MSVLGARVGRVDRPTRALVTLGLSVGRGLTLLVSTSRVRAGVGFARRPRGMPLDAFGGLLRKRLADATLVSIESGAIGSRLVFATAMGLVVLDARAERDASGFAFIDEAGRIVASTYANPEPLPPLEPVDEATLHESGASLAEALAQSASNARRKAITSALSSAITRADRKIAAIEKDAARADRAPALRQEADLLVAAARDDLPGRASLEVLDFHADPPSTRVIELDPRVGPRTEATRRYALARRLERGVAIAAERAEATRIKRDRLIEAKEALARRDDEGVLDELEALLGDEGLEPKAQPERSRNTQQIRRPFREYRSARGLLLRVGKSAADNDALTITLAKPHHLFVHVRGRPGSHVIVVLDRNQVADEQTLVDASTLAAHFSSARGESPIEIVYAERRFIRKPRGSAPGSVKVDREKTMLLRVEPSRLARLLTTER